MKNRYQMSNKILNLTQHYITPEQEDDGVIEPHENKELIQSLLTFEDIPSLNTIILRANTLTDIAVKEGVSSVMIGGAGYLMKELENALLDKNIIPLYSFTKRISIDEHMPDGTVEKTVIFKHDGFIRKDLK